MKKRVIVGLSGGVDSSVSAYLLQEQGYEVIGLFMRNWNDESVVINNECPWIDDSNDALLVAQSLGIPFQVVDLSAGYKERIVDYMFREYERGRTPNPDVLCNREIKFDLFLQTALGLGADYVATGHYCQKRETTDANGQPVYSLVAGADANKDQSYFLCQLNQAQLSRALFPIGHLQKSEVRAIAKRAGLITADKKDSQGLCFVGKIKLPTFLQQQLQPKNGAVVEIAQDWTGFAQHAVVERFDAVDPSQLEALAQAHHYPAGVGQAVGQHEGAHFYTIGQRKGLHIGGKPLPLFVLAVDTQANLVHVGQGDHHPGLYRQALFIPNQDLHWVRPDLALEIGQNARYSARIRYRQPLETVQLYRQPEGLYLVFERPQRGITPGQFAAWYSGDELLGSGVIFQ